MASRPLPQRNSRSAYQERSAYQKRGAYQKHRLCVHLEKTDLALGRCSLRSLSAPGQTADRIAIIEYNREVRFASNHLTVTFAISTR